MVILHENTMFILNTFQDSKIMPPLSNLIFPFSTVAPLAPVSKTMLVIQLVLRFGLTGHSKNFSTNEQHPIGTERVHDLSEAAKWQELVVGKHLQTE